MSTLTWLITGASSGQGAELALAALKAGHRVVATARQVRKAQELLPEIESLGGVWLALDVTSADAQDIAEQAVLRHGVDILVNNAGYGLRGVLEDLRTPFQNAVDKPECVMSEAYKGTMADLTAQRITAGHGRQAGDPKKAAQAIVEVVTGTGRGSGLEEVQRLPLGRDAVQRAYVKIRSLTEDVERTKEVAEWAVFDESYDGYPPLE
ncbi:hypothetical protein B0A50_06504 [Salinomyces thailandicus]|uniref:Uncharacterized protein n=1 Tax=Salinomyces thailandicus TaxID=706561 RepID=A0A4U0TNS6_9PEZI|nr:hypothetical protein B0A50_06504 [Salinomyces thailandica]